MPKIQLRQDVSANWTTQNPVLLLGELGIETDTNKFKMGDGVNCWNNLDYIIPTKTSDLINDSGYINISAIPTLTSQLTNDSGFLTQHQDISHKQDILTAGSNITIENNVISATDNRISNYNDLENKPQINGIALSGNKTSSELGIITSNDLPSKTSDLTNDSGFINISFVPTATSQLLNDSGYVTSEDIPTVGYGNIRILQGEEIKGSFSVNQNYDTTIELDSENNLAEWGNITGDLSDQTDLITALSGKQDVLTSDNAGTDIEITSGAGGVETVNGVGSVTLEDAQANGLNSVTLSGKCEQTFLPNDYTRTLSTANDATTNSKINTGLLPQDGDVIELKIHTGAGVSFYAFQSRISGGASIFGISGSSSGSTISADWGSTLNSNIARTADHDLIIRVSFVNGVKTIYVKDLTDNTEDTQTGTYDATSYVPVANYYLWGNTVNYLNREYPVYEVKLTNNGVTRLHYIPCTRNSDGAIGFYDLATNTFVTTETAVLTSGGVAPSPDYPLDIICNNGVIEARNKSGIPLGYQRVEYLQSTGTQYIDTGFNIPDLTDSYRVELKMTVDGGTGNPASSNNLGYMGQNSGLMLTYTRDYGLGIASSGVPVTSGHIFEVVQKRNADCTRELIVDNTTFTVSTQTTLYADRNYGIFRLSPFDQTYNAIYGKIYEFKAYKNDVLTHNLIPCRRKSDSVLGMYNTVNDVFLTNAGTGTFSAGNDVDDFEITTDGTIETVTDESGNTATAEMLLSVGDYKDTQELLTGTVTCNVRIKVLDGTEAWSLNSGYFGLTKTSLNTNNTVLPSGSTDLLCTHFYAKTGTFTQGCGVDTSYVNFKDDTIATTLSNWKSWLAEQYANGTPVIIIYPLATPTTETVTGQTLTTIKGDNTLTITQASIENLGLEAKYKAGVSVTVEEIEEANLSNQVTVTIGE